MTIELPLPPRECSPNWTGHYMLKANAVRRYRDDCHFAFYLAYAGRDGKFLGQNPNPLHTPITIHLEYFCCRRPGDRSYFPKDSDNAIGAFKHGRDSLKDAGLIPDDSAKYVIVGRCNIYRTKREHKGRCCLIVTIEEAPCA